MKGQLVVSILVQNEIKPEIMEGFAVEDRQEGVERMVEDVEEMLHDEFDTSECDKSSVSVAVSLSEIDDEGSIVSITRGTTYE